MIKKYISIFLIILISPYSKSQENTIDSLINLLNITVNDTVKFDLLYELHVKTFYNNLDESRDYAQQALFLAERMNYQYGIALSYESLGYCYERNSEYNYAIDSYTKALQIYSILNNKKRIALMHFRLGVTYSSVGLYSEQLKNYQEALTFYEQLKDSLFIGYTLGHIGKALVDYEKADEALPYFFKGTKLINKFDSTYTYNIWIYIAFGACYHSLGDYKKELKSYRDAEKFLYKINSPEKKNYSYLYRYIGNLYMDENNFEEAFRNVNTSLKAHQEANLTYEIAEDYLSIGNVYNKMHEYNNARLFYNKARLIGEKIDAKPVLKDAYYNLYLIHSNQSDYKKALGYHVSYSKILTGLQSEKNYSQLMYSKFKQKLQGEENKLQLERQKNEITEKKKRINMLIWVGSTLLLMMLLIVIAVAYSKQKNITKKNKDLHLQKKMLFESEQARLVEELNFKNKELSDFAIHILDNLEFIEKIQSELGVFKSNMSTRENIKKTEYIQDIINKKLDIEKSRIEFYTKIENYSQAFLFEIQKLFPDLTKKEMQLAALIRLNFSSNEIARLFNISVSSVIMARHRLRKKMHLDSEQDLFIFLRNISLTSEKK